MSVADPTVGRISAVKFPPQFNIVNNQIKILISLPGPEVRIVAVDISQGIQPGDTNVVLALITFEGLRQGVTSIEVSDDNDYGIQDESATIMRVTIINGELTVVP